MRDTEEDYSPDVDDDGNPLTIGAAQRMYHKNDNRLYVAHGPTFKS